MHLFQALFILLKMSVFAYQGKSSPMLSDDRISLQCLKDFMLLELDLQDIPKLKPTSLHLREFSCRPHEVRDTKAIFRVPFDGCGTTQGTFSDHIVFQNAVDNSQEINRTRVAVRHVPELHYPFSCRYRQKYTLTLREGETREETNEDDNSNREDFLRDLKQHSSASRAEFNFLLALLMILCFLRKVDCRL
ncbi:hypothetical protein P5673_022718 [Acropora cervicornis]|uniref:ZP domain-containing protein n=1 Tax=Acropora cervicornis TaxID=6130 RepID=A0AAD9Q6K9_ACRCE|nr:hypothetical protein P5673_022718 [Acropora cervicornis]